jgi:hypothetical protein
MRVAGGVAAGRGVDGHMPGGSVDNVGGRHENRYSKETGHNHWRCCVACDDAVGQCSWSGEGRVERGGRAIRPGAHAAAMRPLRRVWASAACLRSEPKITAAEKIARGRSG